MAATKRALAARVAPTPTGRPPRLDDELIAAICAGIRAGTHYTDAVGAVGVRRDLAWDWQRIAEKARAKIKRGERTSAHERTCIRFSDAVRLAVHEGVTRHVVGIASAAQRTSTTTKTTTATKQVGTDDTGRPIYATETTVTVTEEPPDWRASAWILSHRFPQMFHTRTDAEVSGPDGGAIPIEHRVAGVVERLRSFQAAASPALEPVEDAEVVESASPVVDFFPGE